MVALLNSGCGDAPEGGSNVKLAEAGGIVTYNGSPLAGATVTFIPDTGPISIATTDLAGKFKLSTGATPGVAIGKCKVTVMAVEGGGKSAAPESPVATNSKPANPEDMKKMMGGAKAKMVDNAGGNEAPKSIIPEFYGKATTSKLSFTVEADTSKNQFTIDLKD
jgi:hypothetical protein